MQARTVHLNVPLSHLVPCKRNPRRVKPSPEADRQLMALIRSQGLLHPLVVRPLDGRDKHFEVVAGHRRLRVLREIHREDGDAKIPCILKDVDAATAEAMALGENFGREAMHPLDEAEAFARLASSDGKDANAIAAEFGVKERYVRQRMKLATLAKPVKESYRHGQIDTATAEAFAAVPEDRQMEVWNQVQGHPRHAEQVKNIIAHAWIDASLALFDPSSLPESKVTRDLFGDRVLVERQAFFQAQANALELERQARKDEGWSDVVVVPREEIQDRLYSMQTPRKVFDEATTKKLQKLSARRQKLEAAAEQLDDTDETRLEKLQDRLDDLDGQAEELMRQAPEQYSEETKAVGTAFLILDPDGRVQREYRLPRQRQGLTTSAGGSDAEASAEAIKVPTSDDLSDRQLALTFTHEALAVREAVLKDPTVLNRLLVMILHEKVRSEAFAIRHEVNGTTLHAERDGFASPVQERMQELREKLDPFQKEHYVDDVQAYERLKKLSLSKLHDLIALLTVSCLTSHLQRKTPLVRHLARELKVNVRDHWGPDADWLSGYKKLQLADLITKLKGAVHAPAPERKKSDLIDVLVQLFADAAEGGVDDKPLAERLNHWLPTNLRDQSATNPTGNP